MADSLVTTRLYDDLQSEVHVWYCNPRAIMDRSKLVAYKSILSEQEIERYHRFRFDKDRHSYLVSHVLLRSSLSRYSDRPASDWQFCSNEHGKPELATGSGMPGIRLNLTHTDGLSACVISRDRACGIDAENITRANKLDAIAQRMFADEELEQLDKNNLQQQFFYYWTLREAYVKALGTGLSGSSKDFYFAMDPDQKQAVVHHRNIQQTVADGWQFRLYAPTAAHTLAVAYSSRQPVQLKLTELIP